ncbi:co-chaperone GrpE family protein [Actinidia rufa]|uniref:GrpE protein homolog n=1 Tax=Actinidia rufa TaxID=165716 RepID=A0A7J0GUI2_9ERIC|nr:co-chaperone GrpE family protein [Actinidia rufa]
MLPNVYKKAIIDGDEKTTSEAEGMICIVENEKNELVQKLSTFSAEINSGKEKYIFLQADFDNFRKRSEQERVTIRSDAQGEVIESLLCMVDSFGRAKQQIKPETEKEENIDASYQGIYKQFVEILRSLHVAVVPTVGKPFDPSVHEAIAREESQEFKEGIVSQEVRRGFYLGNQLLRPATVKVSTGLAKRNQLQALRNPLGKSTTAAGVNER